MDLKLKKINYLGSYFKKNCNYLIKKNINTNFFIIFTKFGLHYPKNYNQTTKFSFHEENYFTIIVVTCFN